MIFGNAGHKIFLCTCHLIFADDLELFGAGCGLDECLDEDKKISFLLRDGWVVNDMCANCFEKHAYEVGIFPIRCTLKVLAT